MKISTSPDLSKKSAYQFLILLSIVSLFADLTYEGARSITGPYLGYLGANAAVVGFVSGFGEFIGYAFRMLSGYLADRSGKYWTMTIIGYVCNLLVVPLLALAGYWWFAAALLIIERLGKAIRVPPRDAMLSYAGNKIGMGWTFGLHEALDQIGALIGPLVIAGILYFKGSYQTCFAILLIPALFSLSSLFIARSLYPRPQELEMKQNHLEAKGIPSSFWLYLVGAAFIAAGYADFPLLAYHFHQTKILSSTWIPISYALAMGINSLTAPIFGHFYDRSGFAVLIIVSIFSSCFAPLVFWGNFELVLIGIAVWSIGVSAHESLMRAIVANLVPRSKRASAYGIFNMGYGFSWFLGSFLMGLLYDISIRPLVIFSIAVQLLALPFLYVAMKKMRPKNTAKM